MIHDCKLDELDEFNSIIGYGHAINLPAFKLDAAGDEKYNGWWIGNGEYQSQIRYCPYCGLDLYSLNNELERIIEVFG